MPEHVEIRLLALAEVGTLVEWAAGEGWNPGPDDAAAFHAADPGGFLGCFVDGAFAAGISAVAYGAEFGFIGLYISRPEFRGRGYGLKVWTAGMQRLDGRVIGLDGVPAQQENYRAMGFETAYATQRWSGRIAAVPNAATRPIACSKADVPAMIAYDRRFFPAPREDFLKAWLSPPRKAFAVIVGGDIRGYAVIRDSADGAKIGPLFADDGEIARELLFACAAECDGPVHLDVPAGRTGFAALLQSLGLERGFETARMYKGGAPAVDQDGIYAITTLELG
jgi:hypothetical protein